MFYYNDVIQKGPFRGDIFINGEVEMLPKDAGVYFWRRSLPADPRAAIDESYFLKWLNKSISLPFLRAKGISLSTKIKQEGVTIRNDFINIESFEIGGGILSEKKKVDTTEITDTINKRSSLMNLLDDILFNFGPILYVGETDSIRTRIKEHINANSPLRLRLAELGLDIQSTTLNILLMPGSNGNERKLLEQILTHLLVSPLTFRAG